MRTSKKGIDFIADFEGWYPEPYNDPAGYATIGFGHLIAYRPVTQADRDKFGRLTQGQGYALLAKDLQSYEASVDRLTNVELLQGQFDALVSFTYNLGEGCLRDLVPAINRKDWLDVAVQMRQYVHAGSEVLPGLVRRRKAEVAMLLDGSDRSSQVHRQIHLGDHGDDVRWLQKAIPVRAKERGVKIPSVAFDGTAGAITFKAARDVAYYMGVDRKFCDAIGRSHTPVVAQYVQAVIRTRRRRKVLDLLREKMRLASRRRRGGG